MAAATEIYYRNLYTMKLTKRQKQVLTAIQAEIKRLGYPPSIAELGRRIGLANPAAVVHHLDALEKKGVIRRDRKVSRGIVVIESKEAK